MKLIRAPGAPILVRIVSWILALAVGGAIVWLVFNFGYYASGLAALKEDQRRREQTPIPLSFGDPNSPPPQQPAPADTNAPGDPNAPKKQPAARRSRPGAAC